MKTSVLRTWTVVGLSVLTATASLPASADEATATTAKPEKTYTGMVKSVDETGRTVTVKKFLFSKRFNVGDACVFSFANKDAASIAGVRPGQKVTIGYQDANGVLVADSVTQVPLRYKGTVKTIDLENHEARIGNKTFKLADDCTVLLRDHKAGTLADVKPGHLVMVLHEDHAGIATARKIAQTSDTFTGSLTAIDLNERTIKARATFGSKEFHLADNCTILLGGEPANMKNLKPGDKLEFSFDNVNGVNVATRIVPANAPAEAATAQAQ